MLKSLIHIKKDDIKSFSISELNLFLQMIENDFGRFEKIDLFKIENFIEYIADCSIVKDDEYTTIRKNKSKLAFMSENECTELELQFNYSEAS